MVFDEKSRQIGRLLLVFESLLAILVFLGVYRLRKYLLSDNPTGYYAHLPLLIALIPVQAMVLWYHGAYRGLRIVRLHAYAWSVVQAVVISFAVLFALVFMFKATFVSRAFIAMFGVFDVVALVVLRAGFVWGFRHTVEHRDNFLRVLVIGTGKRAVRLVQTLRRHAEWGVDVIGYLDPDPERVGISVLGASVLGTVDDIGAVLEKQVVDEVIVAVPRTMIKDMREIADACEEQGVRLQLMADVFDAQVTSMRLTDLGGIPLLSFEPIAQNEIKLLVKRMIDLAATLVAMPVVLPLMALVAIAIKFDSPGPVLFVQSRVGLRKRVFPMYKFRSMCQDAEAQLKQIEHLNEAEGPIFKIAHDPRVTRVGRFIRRTSLDELPQIFNVMLGHMSLVGPRPMSVRDVLLFDSGIQRKRFSVRPGLTCLWQVSGRSNLPFSKWLELDLHYIEHWSLAMDLKILLRTIPVVLRGSGAV